ncbi:GGDEF domain-containing response regulator [Alkalidesulfovibrio alkalitolerans]|nr:diguanylate cyclase [Alkalidesulfovibrio alkalitolerans]
MNKPGPEKDGILVLVAEDDAIIREQMAMTLRRAGMRVITAVDGHEAFETYLRSFPDLVVSDIRMPRMDGLELARRIREMSNDVCIILVSAYSDNETLFASINLRVDGFARKPVLPDELVSLTRRCNLHGRGERSLLSKVMDHNPDMFLTTDGERALYVNQPLMRFLGIASIEGHDALHMLGTRITPAHAAKHPDSPQPHAASVSWIADLVRQGGGADPLLAVSTPTGREPEPPQRTFLVRVGRLPLEDTVFSIVSFADVTRIQEERDFYLELALKDSLTGLGNRRRLMDELAKEAVRAGRYAKDLSIIILDIDDFKVLNDTHGHQVGDHVLCEIARIMEENVRQVDLLARHGGEEFCCLAPETGLEGAQEMAEKLRRRIALHDFDVAGRVTASFGVALFDPSETPEQFMARADKALYQAKRQGKNQVCVADAPETA